MPTFLSAVDLKQNELRNARLQNLAVAPLNPVAGQIYFDTVAGLALTWDGSVWSSSKGPAGGDLTGSYPAPTVAAGAITDAKISSTAAIDITKLNTDVLARANHTGSQLSATISDFEVTVRSNRLDQMFAPSAAVSLNSQLITNLSNPINPTDAANKAYVDASSLGLDIKGSCRAATTVNLTLAGLQTVDGVALGALERVLVKDQNSAYENGIYTAAAGTWQRSLDADSDPKVTPGLFTFIEEGTVNADTGWVLTTDGSPSAIVVNSTDLTFTQFTGAGQITAGAGLTKSGPSIDVGGTINRIDVSANAVDIAATYLGQASISTLGTVTTGTWVADTIDLAHGGTASTTAVGARTNLGAVGKFAAFNGGTNSDTIVHNLNSLDVVISVVEVATGAVQIVDSFVSDVNTVTVSYGTAVAANILRTTVIG